ncbi:MAG: hypothetical protein ISR82_04960 [Candidatus Marinimicrobia bacterium]|nr:hypothetical protein [Candidatus Neomarinimicrobiota bacterium]MBL7010549.1 hypothetical protein [Candidatus Neomarinimicrobiota bacterium]MBL7030512.1 hypothetical protein [Candidatus Neomarinimicrobiota bacterium]
MKKSLILAIITTIITTVGYGQTSIGIDIYNRYVWRGTDFGNAAALQPYIEFKKGNLTFGAWSSWAVNSGNANENDIYMSADFKSFSITLTDYFFPLYSGEDKFFDYSEKSGSHFVEASLGTSLGPVGITAGYFFIDPDKSVYIEANYGPFLIGAGNGMYTMEGEKVKDSFQVVNIGLTASRDQFSATYVINPQQETSFLVFGVTF